MKTGWTGALDAPETDVVVVGYGPVGQVLAALLGARGHDVTVLESRPHPYRLPRAAHLDGQTMRTLQAVGVAEALEPRFHRQHGYEFYSADRELMHRIDFTGADPSGWAGGYFFFGPELESALNNAVHRSASVDVRRGRRVIGLTQHDMGVIVDVLDPDTHLTTKLSARYVVGADGANSTVRELAEIGWTDLGFQAQWLVVDIAPHDGDATRTLPEAAQILDPVRPVSTFRWIGTEHARLEFMVLAGESEQELTDETRVWNLLQPWELRPENCVLIRRAVYTFRSRLADTFDQGRVLLTGDAAHLMPPFLGQGMCSGIRDAAALAWRLGRALSSDRPTDRLFDTYTAERRAHVRIVIEGSIAVGRILGATSDTIGQTLSADALRTALAGLPAQLPDLTCGGIAEGHQLAGMVFPQETVSVEGGPPGRFDSATGRGWKVLTSGDLPPDIATALEQFGVRTWRLGESLTDIDGRYGRWMADEGVGAVLVRPDSLIFGACPTPAGMGGLVSELADLLGRDPATLD